MKAQTWWRSEQSNWAKWVVGEQQQQHYNKKKKEPVTGESTNLEMSCGVRESQTYRLTTTTTLPKNKKDPVTGESTNMEMSCGVRESRTCRLTVNNITKKKKE